MFGEKHRTNFLDRMMLAVTFAEAGQWETARQFLETRSGKKDRKKVHRRVERRSEGRPVLRA